MIRYLPLVVELALLVFCVIDVIQSPDAEIRNLPKWAWLVLIILLPLIGSIAWLVAGRPVRVRQERWRPGSGFPENERPAVSTSDIDARLDADLARVDREHEEALRAWQQDLERRERQLTDEPGTAEDLEQPDSDSR